MAKKLLRNPAGKLLFEDPGDLLALNTGGTTTTGPVNPCSDPALEFTVTGINAGNRDGTDGGGDYINWIGKKWYNNVSQPVCPVAYGDRDTCSTVTTGGAILHYPAFQKWSLTTANGRFALWAQTGGTVSCVSPTGSPCAPIFAVMSGAIVHNGAVSFTLVRLYSGFGATCAPPGFNTPTGFPGPYVKTNIATSTQMQWFGSAQIPRPVQGTIVSTQGISISWQEYAGW